MSTRIRLHMQGLTGKYIYQTKFHKLPGITTMWEFPENDWNKIEMSHCFPIHLVRGIGKVKGQGTGKVKGQGM